MMNFLYPLGQLRYNELQIISTKANEEKEHNIRLTTIITFEFASFEPSNLLVQQALENYEIKYVHHAFELHLCIYILIILKVLKNPKHRALVVC
jgi:hypothetical protein